MKLVLLVLGLVVALGAGEPTKEEGVLVLTEKNFQVWQQEQLGEQEEHWL